MSRRTLPVFYRSLQKRPWDLLLLSCLFGRKLFMVGTSSFCVCFRIMRKGKQKKQNWCQGRPKYSERNQPAAALFACFCLSDFSFSIIHMRLHCTQICLFEALHAGFFFFHFHHTERLFPFESNGVYVPCKLRMEDTRKRSELIELL